ncbi:M16 family metallopeptidase [Cumulibacter soli]|uniref:M16 family metallopeptidase n=1 Tax=Cumulibacter soli TaxID=2546344 RepID=UPI00106824E3|nr:pitrilysin family protein [Cumulibacter soli]
MRSPNYAVHRSRLPNGLRVVLSPTEGAAAVGIAVHYDVGMRSEPEGRTGFAHLFEHLMFEGSQNVPTGDHAQLVQGVGGSFNGSTHPDYTEYHQVVPPHALERTLFLEADRMRAPLLTAQNMQNQIDVVQEEIRVNVLNRPYGGFPWLALPPVLFETFANTHNGYGDFVDLQASDVAVAREFFATYYAPGNAVLTIAGEFDLAHARALVRKHFADIPARDVPQRPDFSEPVRTSAASGSVVDPHAPMPATAIGWQSPDPIRGLRRYLGTVVLADVLYDGDASRLHHELVLQRGLALSAYAYCGTFGDPFDQRGASTFTIQMHHADEQQRVEAVRVVDEILAELAEHGPSEDELHRVTTRMIAQLLREYDSTIERALRMGTLELLYGKAELLNELPEMIAAVSAADVARAARRLTPESRAIVSLNPARDKDNA